MPIQSYRDLLAWQLGMDLVDEIYVASRGFPKDEVYGLRSQMRRAAMSIPLNIAEGHGRYNLRDFRRFLREARGSCLELETQIIIAKRRGYIEEERVAALLKQAERVGKVVSGLIRYVSQRLRTTENGQRTTWNATPRMQTSKRQ